MYISAEQLHSMELCIYHGLEVQVEGLYGATYISDLSMHRKPELAQRGPME